MAHYISKEELSRMDSEREIEHADKSWTDLDIQVPELSEREKRRKAREEKKELERLKTQLEEKRKTERRKKLQLERRKKEAADRAQMRNETEEEKMAEKQRLLELARKKREAEERKQKRLEAADTERMRLESVDRERMRLDADDRERRRLETEDRDRRKLEAAVRGKDRVEAEYREKSRVEAEHSESRRQEAEETEQRRVEAEEEEMRLLDEIEKDEELRRLQAEEDELDEKRRERLTLETRWENSESRADYFDIKVQDIHLNYEDESSDINADADPDINQHTVGRPVDNSTDIEDVKEQHKPHGNDNLPDDSLERELYWLDKKLQELKYSAKKKQISSRHVTGSGDPSRYADTRPKPFRTESKDDSPMPKEVKKERADRQVKKERETDYSMRRPLNKKRAEPDNEPPSDDTERKLREKIERLKNKDKDMSFRIADMRAKEKEMQKKKEHRLREERIRKLREQEQSLVESLREKESVLSKLEETYREQSLEDSVLRELDGKSREEKEKTRRERKDQTDKYKRQEKNDQHRRQETREKERQEKKDQHKRREKDERKVQDSQSTVSYRKPTIPRLTEDTFEEWKTEVEVVLSSNLYHADIVRQEVRNSLIGKTRKILLNMDPGATTKELITKLENVYGNIRTGESVLAEFYQAKQKDRENVAEWGVRVESILNTAIKKGQVKKEQADEMLRNRFWRHLKSDQLKNATRVCYETAENFEELRKKVRIEENEMKVTKESEKVEEKQVTSHQRCDNDEQLTLMKSLISRMEKLEAQIARQAKQSDDTKHERQDRDTQRNQGRYEGPRRGNWNNRGNWSSRRSWNNRGDYGNRGHRGNYNQYSNRNQEYTSKESDRKEQSQENRTSQESGNQGDPKSEQKNLN